VNQDELGMYRTQLTKTVNHIGNYFLQGRSYIGGDDVTVADLQALCELMQLDVLGQEYIYMSNPDVKAWAGRVKARLRPYFEEVDREGLQPMKQTFEQMTSSKL